MLITNEEIKHAIRTCEWKTNNHYSLNGKKDLFKGICTAKGSVCSKVIDNGNCPVLLKLFKVGEQE